MIYEKHKKLSHPTTRHSRNGINIIVECDTCKLAWELPFKGQRDQHPVTLRNWYKVNDL